LIGVNLRDQDVQVFAEKEVLERKTEQSFWWLETTYH
jgi:hypothetical protein